MRHSDPVASIMTKSVVFADSKDSLRKVTSTMKEHNVRHLPVVSNGKLAGIVSKSDILRLSFGDMYDDQSDADETIFDMLTLEQVMVGNPTTVKEDDSIADAAKILSSVEFHALPVMKGDQIVGIVSTTDLIKYLLEKINNQ
ncbi:MAG: CBS domain-containing protein [Chitinophagaceae bacterium]|nr:CBS domain-containing protein [Chitinophagaceae bacterium]